MQRPTYANSPPLHHPVPQHVSTVPQLRSPPPPTSANSQYGYAAGQSPPQGQGQGQQGQAGNYMHPAFGGFMNDSTAQMGFQIGKSAVDAGQQYVEQNVCPVQSTPSHHITSSQYELCLTARSSSTAMSMCLPSNTTSTSPTATSSPNSSSSSSPGDIVPGHASMSAPMNLANTPTRSSSSLPAKMSTHQTCTYLSWPSSHTHYYQRFSRG